MRTRLIKPGFFIDETMAKLTVATRLVYIGLWTLCDDAGYFERKPGEISVALFPYETPRRRQQVLDAGLAELVTFDRVRWLECGDHGLVPTLPDHVTKAGNHAYTHRDRHRDVCVATLFSRRSLHESVRSTDKSRSESVSESGSSSESESTNARANETKKQPGESFADWSARIAAVGPRRIGFAPPEASDD